MQIHIPGGIFALIWIALVVFSFVRQIRRAARSTPVTPSPSSDALPRDTSLASQVQAAVVRATRPLPKPKPPPPTTAPLASVIPSHGIEDAVRRGTPSRPEGVEGIASLLKQRQGIVRAVVAAEILGPPKAIAEQTIWSPPHSAP